MNFLSSKKIQWVMLILMFLMGFAIRFYKFNNPVADWHSWRQADTSAVSRNFVRDGFDLLYPKFDDLSNVPSGIYDNPQGLRFVEFPIYNVLQAGGYLLFHTFSLEEWGRLVTIFSSMLSAVFVFLLMRQYANKTAAFFATFFYLFLPFNIYYSRTILPDESMVTATLGGIYFFSLWIHSSSQFALKKTGYVSIAAFFFATALLLKPFAIFFFLPAVFLAYQKWGKKVLLKKEVWLLTVISILPLVFWRIWISAHPEGIPQSWWLFNGGNIRFTGAYFRWIFAIRISELILGFWGLPILVIGIVAKQKSKLFFYAGILSSLLYLFIVARGNVQHDYYQIPIIPIVSMLLGVGCTFLLFPPREFISQKISRVVLFVACVFMLAFSWFEIRDYYNINNPAILTTGKAVDELTPKNAKIVAPFDGDTTLLYAANRKGWSSFEKPLPQLIKMGADYLVIITPKKQDLDIGKTYKIIAATADYVIFDLHKSP